MFDLTVFLKTQQFFSNVKISITPFNCRGKSFFLVFLNNKTMAVAKKHKRVRCQELFQDTFTLVWLG